ncbi:MAG: hypothetical protein ACPLKP_01620 [Microgenomates group bacterium]
MIFPIFFFLLGVISILAQALILREIANLFYSNEMFYGLGLGSWMLFSGLGGLFGIKFKKFFKNFKFLWVILGILVFLLPLLIIYWRWLVGLLVSFGELPDPIFVFMVIFPPLFIFCFLLGAVFALGVSFWRPNLGYFWETIGFTAGGLIFSFILATINFSFGLKWRYPGLEKVINSKYQQIIINNQDNQRSYFVSGQLAFTNQESYETKQILSLIIPFVKEDKKILVFGNPNIASEIKKLSLSEKIIFIEIDEKLANLEKELLIPGIDLIISDPRQFLNDDRQQWNLIIFSLGNPQTLLTNRYFTYESFEKIKNRLSKNGIFALIIHSPTDYQSEEAARFVSSLYQTLKIAFPFLELLTPEDQLIFLAGFEELKINQEKISFQFKDYFWYQIDNQRRQKILEKIQNTPAEINNDFNPTAFFYQQLFWQTIFSFKLPVYLIKLVKIIPIFLLILLFLILLFGSRKINWGVTVAISSFILISLEILLIFIFQTKIGYLYSQIALIFAAVLIGIGLGVGVIEKKYLKIENWKLKILFMGYLPFLFLIHQVNFWPILALGIGFIGGMIFALINKNYLKKYKNPGFIYAFDLFGGFLGAILTSSFLLPGLGVKGVLIFLGGIVLGGLLSIAKLRG